MTVGGEIHAESASIFFAEEHWKFVSTARQNCSPCYCLSIENKPFFSTNTKTAFQVVTSWKRGRQLKSKSYDKHFVYSVH